jgi:hypothetical protein
VTYRDPMGLDRLINFYIANPEARKKIIQKGQSISLKYTFSKMADHFLAAFSQRASSDRTNIITCQKTQTSAELNLSENIVVSPSYRQSLNNIDKFIYYASSSSSPKISRISSSPLKILYVTMIPHIPGGTGTVRGVIKAYGKVGDLIVFDYRGIAEAYGVEQMNRLLVQTAVQFGPDIIHLEKAETVRGDVLRSIKEQIDTYILYAFGDFRIQVPNYLVDINNNSDRTLLSFTDERILNIYSMAGVRNVDGVWRGGIDPDIFYPRDVKKSKDIVFMGTNWPFPPEYDGYAKRKQLLENILLKGLDLHIYGDNWEHMLNCNYKTLNLHPLAWDNECSEVYSSAKITLGINCRNDIQGMASWPRTFNSMASGAFHLTHYIPGLETMFENHKHLAWFNSVPEAMELIEYYLNNDIERERIAKAARDAIIRGHTTDLYIEEIISKYQQSKQGPHIQQYERRMSQQCQ